MSDYNGILIYDEITDGHISLTTRELLTAGRKLGDQLGQPLNALLIGKDTDGTTDEIISFGADHVYTIEGGPHSDDGGGVRDTGQVPQRVSRASDQDGGHLAEARQRRKTKGHPAEGTRRRSRWVSLTRQSL